MANEQNKTLEAIQTAIQMEIDGKEFYLKASLESSNGVGKKLLEQLAAEEDIHRKKFEEIFAAIRNKKDWPVTDYEPGGGEGLRTIFAEAFEELGSDIKAAATELDAVQTAMNMENKSYDFYKRQSEEAAYDAEKKLFETLAGVEKEHHRVLLDYYEYLKDPAAWFVEKEHSSLDGG